MNNAENYFSIFKRGINGIYSTVKSLNIQIKEGTSFNIHHWSIFISDIGHNDPDAPCEFDIKMG